MPTERMESQKRGPAGSRPESLYEDEDDSIKMCKMVRVWRRRKLQCKTASGEEYGCDAASTNEPRAMAAGGWSKQQRLELEDRVKRRAAGTSDDEISRAGAGVQLEPANASFVAADSRQQQQQKRRACWPWRAHFDIRQSPDS